MSVETNHFNPVLHSWKPDTYQEEGISYIVEESFTLPEYQLFVIEGLTGKAYLESQDKYVSNGQIVWFNGNQEMTVLSLAGKTGIYKDLTGRPNLKGMAYAEDAPDGKRYVRTLNNWVPAYDAKFNIWEPSPLEGSNSPYFTKYVLKDKGLVTGQLSMSGNKLSVEGYNTGNTDSIVQYVTGWHYFDMQSPFGLYFRFPNVPSEFNHIKLAVGYLRSESATRPEPYQEEKLFGIDGIIMANEIQINGLGGIPLQSQVRVNFHGSLTNLELCLSYNPTSKELSLYYSQSLDPIAKVTLDEGFYIDHLIMGLDADIPRYNREVDYSIEMLSNPNTVYAGIPPYTPSAKPFPYITREQYPLAREGRGFEIKGMEEDAYLYEIGQFVSNGNLIWFDSEGIPRIFNTSNFSGKFKDLSGIPSFSKVATSGSYTDLYDLPSLGTASEKDIDFFTTKEEFNSQVQDTDQEIAELNQRGDEITQNIENHKTDSSNPHNVTQEQVGLGNVDNTGDMDKPVSSAQGLAIEEAKQEAIDYAHNHKIDKAQLHMPGGVAILDSQGKLVKDQLPELVISRVHVVNNEAEQLALEVQSGDVAVRLDEDNNAYMLRSEAQNVSMNDWVKLNQTLAIPDDAPMDGGFYGRKNGTWDLITSIGGREFN